MDRLCWNRDGIFSCCWNNNLPMAAMEQEKTDKISGSNHYANGGLTDILKAVNFMC